ncbi:winged helix-turn-helix transcriptional regulator [Pseudomonas sp. 5P_3.1_Bac2]|uniref:winged helix-turn-helix transcriptional regulator n=1 Tax=Pseudomonas sp. 5P_3.1_Bac2 TaxID=2971617 RepID=UPI0021C7DBEC|nr:helix-turn-helix domain-containing protein [Pseudomonas sp. 5P_3.1_Bac2]MCU1717865.1 helix-turn-helix transcriptional regulator [Pseudomonas sp. 5P_3.1_Bac2]
MRWEELDQQPCSLARTLSVVGDRWTLLVLRECFLGTRRFDDFQARLGVTRHVLADRLKTLVEAGVLHKEAYQQRPLREEYRLSAKGLDLYPVIVSLVDWGDRHMSGPEGAPIQRTHKRCGKPMQGVLVCSECGEPLHGQDVALSEAPAFKGQLLPAHWHAK